MIGAIDNAFVFLVNTIFSLFTFLLGVRFILVYVGANYHDPITQFVVKFTDFCVKPVRRIIPNIKRIETATLLLLLVVGFVKFMLVLLLNGSGFNPLGLLILALADTCQTLIMLMFYAIIAHVILSWIQPYSPVMQTLTLFTSPIMYPIRKLIPPIGGFDITPIPAIIVLQLILILFVGPIMHYGSMMAM